MSQILNKVRDVDANNSDAVKEALSAFFQNLPKHTETNSNQWLRVLENIINRFPKYCMSHRNTVEIHLTHFLDVKDYYDVIEAAKCALVLQQVRPSQAKTATPKSCWRNQVEILCNAIHSLIGALFGNDVCQRQGSVQNTSTTVPLTPLSVALTNISEVHGNNSQHYTAEEKNDLLCIRLRNVFVYLQAMLVEVFPVAKPVRPQQILEALVRALSSSSASRSLEDSQVTAIKTQALRSLDALVLCLGTNLVPFSPLVFRLVMQTLRWSSENPSDESRKVRCAAYSSLSLWLSTLKCHNIESTQQSVSTHDQIVKHVLADITPYLHVVELKKGGQPTKNMSKKAKRKLANSMLHDSGIAVHMPGEKNKITDSEELNDDLANAALECAETFLTVCGVFLKVTLHRQLQDRLVRESHALGRYKERRGLRLLRALEASRRAAPPRACPRQYCLRLYSLLQTSASREISMFCTTALMNIRLHLHCSPPSLHFDVVEPRSETAEREATRPVSDRNRAALESLLGADRVPPLAETAPSTSSEVITIPDEQEPARKKPRVSGDVTEQISLSSQSSVEISDDSLDKPESIPDVQEIVFEIEDPHGGNNKSEQTYEVTRISLTRETETEESTSPSEGNEVEVKTIHEANTQLPANISGDIEEQVSPRSPEVAYDFPSTANSKVTVLDKMDDENLPSTNETDDIHITCGQSLKNSQDVSQKKPDDELKDIEPKVNGVAEKDEKQLTNGVSELKDNITESTIIVKIADNNDGVTVEDMLADFVDEVNEDAVNVDA